MHPLPRPINIMVANNKNERLTHQGTLSLKTSGAPLPITVTHAPTFTNNLISGPQLAIQNNATITLDKLQARISLAADQKHAARTITAPMHDKLYIIQQGSQSSSDSTHAHGVHAAAAALEPDGLSWHARLGHISDSSIALMRGAVAGGEDLCKVHRNNKQGQDELCIACILGKAHRQAFANTSSAPAPTQPLELVVADLCGPIRGKYVSVIIDVYSRYVSIKIINNKSMATQHITAFITWAQTQRQCKLKHFHSDGGGEYDNNTLRTFFAQHGTTISITTRDTPQHNGIAERMNLTLLEMTRAMLRHASLPVTYWENAIHTAAYIVNRCVPRTLKRRRLTRIQAFTGHKPSIKHMRVFGCNAYMHVQRKHRDSKLDSTSRPCIFIGYNQPDLLVPPYYIVRDPLTNTEHRTRDVTFDETDVHYRTQQTNTAIRTTHNKHKHSRNNGWKTCLT